MHSKRAVPKLSSPKVFIDEGTPKQGSNKRLFDQSPMSAKSGAELRKRYQATSLSDSKRYLAWSSLERIQTKSEPHHSHEEGSMIILDQDNKKNPLHQSSSISSANTHPQPPLTHRLSYEDVVDLSNNAISLHRRGTEESLDLQEGEHLGGVSIRAAAKGDSPMQIPDPQQLSKVSRKSSQRSSVSSGESKGSNQDCHDQPRKISRKSFSEDGFVMSPLNRELKIGDPNSRTVKASASLPSPIDHRKRRRSRTSQRDAKVPDDKKGSIHTIPANLLKPSRYSQSELPLERCLGQNRGLSGSRASSVPANISLSGEMSLPTGLRILAEMKPEYNSQNSCNSSTIGDDEAMHQVPLMKGSLPGAFKRKEMSAFLQKKRKERWRSMVKVFCMDANSSSAAKVFQYFMIITTLISLVMVELETLDGPNWDSSDPTFQYLPTHEVYSYLDYVFGIIFSLEFIVRLYVADILWHVPESKTEEDHQHSMEIPFFKDLLNWFDLLAIVPFIIEIGLELLHGSGDIIFLGILKTLRVFKIVRQFNGAAVLVEAVRRSFRPLALPMFFFTVFTLLFAALIYYFEPCMSKDTSQCEFTDVFNAAYFIIVTMTTVGYGDQVPTRILARLVTLVVMIFGALFLSMPLAIIGNEFDNVWKEKEAQEEELKETETHTEEREEETMKEDKDYQNLLDEFQPKVNRLQNSFMLTSEGLVNLRFEMTEKMNGAWTQASLMMLLNSIGQHKKTIQSLILEIHALCEVNKVSQPTDQTDKETPSSPNHLARRGALRNIHTVKAPDILEQGFFSAMRGKTSREGASNTNTVLLNSLAWGARSAARGFDFMIHHQEMPMEGTRRHKIWLLLERPESSRKAKFVNLTLFVAILLGTLMFCLQTLPSLQVYGEASLHCEKVVASYCADKESWTLDPGCFDFHGSFYNSTTNTSTAALGRPKKLKFFCTASDVRTEHLCYGYGQNFGGVSDGALTCSRARGLSPFRSQDDLPAIGLLEINPNAKFPVCQRRECDNTHKPVFDGSYVWFYLEGLINLIFILEIGARIGISNNLARHLLNWQTWVDVLSTLPFLIEVVQAIRFARMPDHSYSLADSPILLFIRLFKVIRIFKMMQHFPSTGILIATFKKSYTKLLVPMFLLFMFVIIFGHVVYYFERGQSCYVGNTCSYAPDLQEFAELYGWPEGKRVLVNHKGDPTDFPDFRSSIWLTMLTLTSVGYGRIAPISVLGRIFAAVIMLFGNFYLAMPLTIVGGIFFSEYKAFKLAKEAKAKNKGKNQEAKEIQLDLYHSSLIHEATYSLSYLDSVKRWANMQMSASPQKSKIKQVLSGSKKMRRMSTAQKEHIRQVDPVEELGQALLCFSSLTSVIRRISEELMGRKKQELKVRYSNWAVLHTSAKRDSIMQQPFSNHRNSMDCSTNTKMRSLINRRVSIISNFKKKAKHLPNNGRSRYSGSIKSIPTSQDSMNSRSFNKIRQKAKILASFGSKGSHSHLELSEKSREIKKESLFASSTSTEQTSEKI